MDPYTSERAPFAKGLYSTLKVPAVLTKKILVKGTPLLLNETLWAGAMAMLAQCYSFARIECGGCAEYLQYHK